MTTKPKLYVYCRQERGDTKGDDLFRISATLTTLEERRPTATRDELLALVAGPDYEVWTAYADNTLKLVEGEQLEVVDGYIAPYLRTRANRITADNFGRLQDCATALLALHIAN